MRPGKALATRWCWRARFHSCLEAESWGMGLLLAAIFAIERFATECLADVLGREFPGVQVWSSDKSATRYDGNDEGLVALSRWRGHCFRSWRRSNLVGTEVEEFSMAIDTICRPAASSVQFGSPGGRDGTVAS